MFQTFFQKNDYQHNKNTYIPNTHKSCSIKQWNYVFIYETKKLLINS